MVGDQQRLFDTLCDGKGRLESLGQRKQQKNVREKKKLEEKG